MTNSLIIIDSTILSIIKGSFGKDGLPLPFVKEIYLMDCHVAGTSHLDLSQVEPGLVLDSPLIFKREPDNQYDPLAIQIFDEHGNRIGYVPKTKNEVTARLMDAGKLIFGKLFEKSLEGYGGKWLKLQIKVYAGDVVRGSVAKFTYSGIPWLRYLRLNLGDHIHFWRVPSHSASTAES